MLAWLGREMGVLGQWLCLPRFGETGRGASWVRDSSVRGGSGIRRPKTQGENTRALSRTTRNSARTQEGRRIHWGNECRGRVRVLSRDRMGRSG